MKKSILISAICLLSIGLPELSAQDYVEKLNYSIGKPYPVIDAFSKSLYYHEGELLSIKRTKKKVSIQKFNAKTLTFLKETGYEDFPKEAQFEAFVVCNGKYYYFYSLWDAKSSMEQIIAREVDFKKGTFIDQGKPFLQVEGKLSGVPMATGFYNFIVGQKFKIELSLDSAKILVEYRKKPEVKRDSKSHDVLGYHVFDSDLKELWSEQVTMPYNEKKMDVLRRTVDKNANVFVLVKVFNDDTNDDRKSKDGPPNFHFEIFRIDKDSKKLDKSTIQLEDKLIRSIEIFEMGDKIVCAGYYYVGKGEYDVDGIFMFRVSKTGIAEDSKYYPIPLEIVKMNLSKGDQAKAEKDAKSKKNDKTDVDNLVLRGITIMDDGSLVISGEQYHSVTTYHDKRSSTEYYYENILVAKINADGTLAWMNKLPKKQIGTRGKGGMSYFYDYNTASNGHYYMFLDNEKNKGLDVKQVPFKHIDGAGGFLAAYHIDHETGDLNKSYIFDTRNVKGIPVFQFEVDRIVNTDKDEYIVEVYKKDKEDILIKLFMKPKK
ncbi:MAG TPA: hypothetical protein PKM97_07705 [Bacteroidia bacterium]|nr:hypothetical protein [Bacteroidia bacterium]